MYLGLVLNLHESLTLLVWHTHFYLGQSTITLERATKHFIFRVHQIVVVKVDGLRAALCVLQVSLESLGRECLVVRCRVDRVEAPDRVVPKSLVRTDNAWWLLLGKLGRAKSPAQLSSRLAPPILWLLVDSLLVDEVGEDERCDSADTYEGQLGFVCREATTV